MVFKYGNYTIRYTLPIGLLRFFISFLLLFWIATLTSQSSCEIKVAGEPTQTTQVQTPSNILNTYCPLPAANWNQLFAIGNSNDQYATVSLAPNKKSNCLELRGFNLNLPPESEIHSLQLTIEGHTEGNGELTELFVQMLHPEGGTFGQNKAEAVSIGTPWPNTGIGEDHVWSYGHSLDNWNAVLDQEMLENPEFGIKIQLKNSGADQITVRIDQIKLTVYYTPVLILCDHDCVAFYVDEIPGAPIYNWTLPEGFDFLNGDEFAHLVNIGVTDAEFGLHEICVETVTDQGEYFSCCRTFLFDDCRVSFIGDFVWEDLNGNGLQDPMEPGINGITVELYNQDSELIAQTVSDQNGFYIFEDVLSGDYYVQLSGIDDFFPTLFNENADPSLNNDITEANGPFSTSTFHLEPNMQQMDIDFGLLRPASTSGLVWQDMNANGLRDINELPISGIEVNLLSSNFSVTQNTFSGLDGSYSFTDIQPGTYFVEFLIPESQQVSPQDQGVDDAIDSDVDAAGLSMPFILTSGSDMVNMDMGLYQFASVGDFVWIDYNRNGIQEMFEPGKPNVLIDLYKEDGTLVAESVADSDGIYSFENLTPGNYFIEFSLPNNLAYTDPDIGMDDDLDSDITGQQGPGTTNVFNLISNQSNNSIDGGYVYLPANICGKTWLDKNGNSTFDDTDQILAEVGIQLLDETGVLIEGTMSNAEGDYCFDDLNPGNYYVVFDMISGLFFTDPDEAEENLDSDVTSTNGPGSTDIIGLDVGMDVNHVDAGYLGFAAIGDFVWLDANADGIQNDPNSGINGIEIILFNAEGTQLQSTVSVPNPMTGENGYYFFEEILPGDYFVRFVFGEEVIPTAADQMDDTIDSDISGTNGPGSTDLFNLCALDMIFDIDGGLISNTGSASGATWKDQNRNGLREINELPLQNLIVSLFNEAGDFISQAITDDLGNYQFNDVIVGDYYIAFEENETCDFSASNVGSDDSIDSDITMENGPGTTSIFSISLNVDVENIDAGYVYKPAKICGSAWLDKNGNSIFDEPDQILSGISVVLMEENGQLMEGTMTDEDGNYCFENLNPGNYYLTFDMISGLIFADPNASDESVDSDVTSSIGPGTTEIISLNPGQMIDHVDAGYIGFAAIGDFVWLDANGDGIQNDPNSGINGVNIILFAADGTQLQSTISATNPATGEAGYYTFDGILPGDYFVRFVFGESLLPTTADQMDDSIDSDLTGSNGPGSTDLFNLCALDMNFDIDAGFVSNTARISGTTWQDQNRNGLRELEETPLMGLLVRLFDEEGIFIDETLTNSTGSYQFLEIIVGNYFVEFEEPDSFDFSFADIGTDDSIDSDVTGSNGTGTTNIFSIAQDMDAINIDAGYTLEFASISGLTWLDQNLNGLREVEEILLSDIQVALYNESDELVLEMFTVNNGTFGFLNLEPGNYYLVFDMLDGTVFTVADAGDDDLDSDVNNVNGIGSTALFNLSPGENRSNNDAGYIINVGGISGLCWEDQNLNGLRDSDEPGLDGIAVQLFDAENNLFGTTTTQFGGNFNFFDVPAGDYYVVFETPQNFQFTTPDAGDDALDSDVTGNIVSGSTDLFTLLPGGNNVNIDAGLVKITSEISGFAWSDLNNDGLQNTDEEGVEDVLVRLFDLSDQLIASTNTDANGIYSFQEIDLGSYYLLFEQKEGLIFTSPDMGDDSVDSDVTGFIGLGSTDVFEIVPGGALIDLDAGYVISQSNIVGVTWLDENRDGIRDDAESRLAGIEVFLYSSEGQLLDTDLTDDAGLYAFLSVDMGDYYLTFSLPDSLGFTLPDIGDNNSDSDVTESVAMGSTDLFTVTAGGGLIALDAGYVQFNGVISGLAWIDLNGNGNRESSETRIAGIVVNLKNELGVLISSTITSTDGSYLFEMLMAGSYYIEFLAPDNFFFTLPNVGIDDTVDSDITNLNGMGTTDLLTIDFDTVLDNVDAGIFELGRIEGLVWNDLNADGIRNVSESPIGQINVRLLDEGLNMVSEVMTGVEGDYSFPNLFPGIYTIQIEAPQNFVFTNPLQGSDQTVDSDIVNIMGSLGNTGSIQIFSGETVSFIDGGLIEDIPEKSSVGDFVWIDNNGNGIFDAGEMGLNNVIVRLFDDLGNFLQATFTADDPINNQPGYYMFDELEGGSYYLEFEPTSNYLFTIPDAGGSEFLDSDVTNTFGPGTTDMFVLPPSTLKLDLDAGVYAPAFIGDFVWNDGNNNGLQDVFELGINDVIVRLFNDQHEEISFTVTTTNLANGTSGYYQFDNVAPGNYYVKSDISGSMFYATPNVGDDDSIDSDVTSENGLGSTAIFNIQSGDMISDIDIGMLVEPAILGDYVWLDINGNGIQDIDEEGLNDVQIMLFNASGDFISMTTSGTNQQTAESGFYQFENVSPGSYYLQFIAPEGLLFTIVDAGGNDTRDSDVDHSNGEGSTTVFTLSSAESDLDWDAGLFIPGGIGDFVWFDSNQNGQQDNDEPGVEGIEVVLFEGANTELASTFTNEDGNYCFPGLRQGLYSIKFIIPDSLQFTLTDATGNDSNDSDAFPSGATPLISLAHAVQFKDMDAGVIPANALIGNRVWLDLNANGMQDAPEPGIMGIAVNLMNEEGDILESSMTDMMGEYIFDQLDEGNYYIHFESPENFVFSQKDAGDDDLDSDADENGNTDITYIDGSSYFKNVDAGIFQMTNIITNTWHDYNENGVRDPFEIGLNNVLVELYNGNDQYISSEISYTHELMGDGYVVFQDIFPGDYYLVYHAPAEMYLTADNIGENENMDSDAIIVDDLPMSPVFTLLSGDKMLELSAGFYEASGTENIDEGHGPEAQKESIKKSKTLEGVDSESIISIQLYPNPTYKDFEISIQSMTETKMQLILMDAEGNQYWNHVFNASKDGEYRYRPNVELVPGIYTLLIVTKASTDHRKLVIVK